MVRLESAIWRNQIEIPPALVVLVSGVAPADSSPYLILACHSDHLGLPKNPQQGPVSRHPRFRRPSRWERRAWVTVNARTRSVCSFRRAPYRVPTTCICGVRDLNLQRSSLFNVQCVHGNHSSASIVLTRTDSRPTDHRRIQPSSATPTNLAHN
jgi:hypothetical protein